MKARHIISIILGIVLTVGGMVLILERYEIALEMVGQEQVMREAFRGGSSFKEALTGITVGGVAGLVIGMILLIFGIIFGIRTNPKQIKI